MDSGELVIRVPRKPTDEYKRLAGGFALYYYLTNCKVVHERPRRWSFRPGKVDVAKAAKTGRRGTEVLSALPYSLRRSIEAVAKHLRKSQCTPV
jgi:hypothetical protein